MKADADLRLVRLLQLARSGHGGPPRHWHGIETLLLLLVAAILGVLLTRR